MKIIFYFENTFTPPHTFWNIGSLSEIIAVDHDNTCLKNITLPEITEDVEIKQTDVRLVESLAATAHFTEVRQVICLRNKSDDYVIADFSTAEYEPYESLLEPYNLYRSFAGIIFVFFI